MAERTIRPDLDGSVFVHGDQGSVPLVAGDVVPAGVELGEHVLEPLPTDDGEGDPDGDAKDEGTGPDDGDGKTRKPAAARKTTDA